MNLLKHEYANVLAFLDRVEVKGHAEAEALVTLVLKIKAKVANWVDAPVPVYPTPATPAGHATPAVAEPAQLPLPLTEIPLNKE